MHKLTCWGNFATQMKNHSCKRLFLKNLPPWKLIVFLKNDLSLFKTCRRYSRYPWGSHEFSQRVSKTGWWFQFFHFHPELWRRWIQFDEHIFFFWCPTDLHVLPKMAHDTEGCVSCAVMVRKPGGEEFDLRIFFRWHWVGKKPRTPENLPGSQNGNFTFAPYGSRSDAVGTRPSGPLTRSPPGPAAIPPTVGPLWRQSGSKGGTQMVTWKSLAGSKPWISINEQWKTKQSWLFRVICWGWNPTQLGGDYFMNH